MSYLKLQLKQNKCLFRESLILGDRNDVLEFCPSRNVTEALILLLPDVGVSTHTELCLCMFSVSCGFQYGLVLNSGYYTERVKKQLLECRRNFWSYHFNLFDDGSL